MKLLFTMNLPYWRVHGGANRSNRRLAEALAAAGEEIHVVVPASEADKEVAGASNSTSRVAGVVVHESATQVALRAELVSQIETLAPDWVLVSTEDPSQSLLRIALNHAHGRVIYLAHTPQMLPFGPASLYPGETRTGWITSAAAVIVISQFMRDYVKRGTGLDAFLFHPPHYDAPAPAPWGRPEGHVLMLNACAAKGISIFMDIARQMPTVPFATLCGYGTTTEDLLRIAAIPNIQILSNPESLGSLFADTSVLLMPSLWLEGFGMAAVDAMLNGIPVIASDFGGLREASFGVATLLPVSPIEHFSKAHDERNLPKAIVPPQNAGPWIKSLWELLSDPLHYAGQAQRSLEAATAFKQTLSIHPFIEFLRVLQPRAAPKLICAEQSANRRRVEGLSPEQRARLIQRLRRPEAPKAEIPVLQGVSEYPLSSSQERLWFLQHLDPTSTAYNLATGVRIGGALEYSRLQASMNLLMQRHSMLRTHFREIDGRPVQIPRPLFPQSLRTVDLSAHKAPAAEARRLIAEWEAEPFSFNQGPPFRCALFRLGHQDHVLVIMCHHIIADGWSLSVLANDWLVYYRGASELPPLPIQFTDYAAWQRSNAWPDADIAYWKQQLDGITKLELPLDYPRTPRSQCRGEILPFALNQEKTAQLREMALTNQATLFMVFLAVFQTLLHRYSGQGDIVTGVPSAGRRSWETERLVGCFVETIAFRTFFVGNPSFQSLLAQVRHTTLDAYTHNSVPFEKLVEELRPERDLTANPIFQTLLVLQNTPAPVGEIPGLTLEAFPIPRAAAQFDLTIGLTETAEGILGAIEYNAELFEPATIDRIARHLNRIVEEIIADPRKKVGDIVLEAYPSLPPKPPTQEAAFPHHLFENHARLTPDAPAVFCANEVVCYRELDNRANCVAGYLQKLGVGIETPVAIRLQRGPDLIAALLGVFKCGAAFVPLDPRWPDAMTRMIDRKTQPLCTLTDETVAQAIQSNDAHLQCTPPPREASAYILYTSGSTGNPKGVVLTYGTVSAFLSWARSAFEPLDFECVLASTSICFDLSIFEIFGPLSQGGALRIVPDIVSATPQDLENISLLNTVPSAAAALLRSSGFPEAVRVVTLAGEPLSPKLADDVYSHTRAARVFDLYGPTETTTFSTWALRKPAGIATIGVPIEGTEIVIVDTYGNVAPPGTFGEILIGGAGLARGYWNQPALTAERFIPHPFREGDRLYRTGDRGRCRNDGQLEFAGRFDRQLKIRGFRIEPGEVEQTLLRHSNIEEAAVAERNGSLVAWIAGGLRLEQARAFALKELPAYAVPSHIWVLEHLPRLPNGKVNWNGLPVPAEKTTRDEAWPSPVAEILASIWEQLLGVSLPGPEADFFEMGGHSLLAVQVISRVRDMFRIEVPLRWLFECPVLGVLAVRIENFHKTDASPQWPLTDGKSDFPLSFAQARMWYLDAFRPDDPSYNIPSAVSIRGKLNREALSSALKQVVQRQATLRTLFPQPGVQRVLAEIEIPVVFVDLMAMQADALDAELRRLIQRETVIGFNLSEGPLMRITLARLEPERHVLVVTLHHICSDAWSTQILLHEWTAFYQAKLEGANVSLPPLPVSYASYATWQRTSLGSELMERNLAYWQRQLENIPPLEFPVDHPRTSYLANDGAVLPVRIGEALTEKLKKLCREASATLFMGLTAVWLSALWRFTGQDEIAIGAPLAGRTYTETENLIGCFINTVCLRIRCGDDPPFRTLLERVRDAALEAYSRQEVPFELLIEKAGLNSLERRATVFQALITLQNVPVREVASGTGLLFEPIDIIGQKAKTELALSLHESASAISGVLEYDTGLFNPETVLALLDTTRQLLEAFIENPVQPIGRPILGPDQPQVEQRFGEEPLSWLHPASESVALRNETGAWTYRLLHEFANGTAEAILALGLCAEDLIGVCLPRGPERVWSFVGILKAGAAFLGFDPDTPSDRLGRLMKEAGLQLVITDAPLLVPPGIPLLNPASIRPSAKPPVSVIPDGENLAYAVFTSGTTGNPKCVGLTHKGLSRLASSLSRRISIDAADCVLQFASPAFDAFVWELVMALGAGAELWVGERDGPATIATIPPSYAGILQHRPELRALVFAGEACRRNDIAPWLPGRAVYNAYGPSEATVCATMQACEQAEGDPPIGQALSHVRIHILDRHWNRMPVGAIGEICIGGEAVGRGYLNDCAMTAERMIPDPFSETPGMRLYRTGDYGRLLADGTLMFVGRQDQQVKLHGYRIELGEIEAAIAQLAGIHRATVLLEEGHLVAYVQSDVLTPELRDDWRALLLRHLPGYMVPTVWIHLDEFPLTTTGKIDQAALARVSRPVRTELLDPPITAAERLLASLWVEQLQLPSVGIHQNFFELGGDSILAIRILAKARQQGLRILPRQVYENPTIAELAGVAEWISAAPVESLSSAGLAPIQQWFLGKNPIDVDHFNQAVLLLPLVDIQDTLLAEAALDLYSHHPALSLAFDCSEGAWTQRIHSATEHVFTAMDLDKDGTTLQQAVNVLQTSFNIRTGLVFRVALIRWIYPEGEQATRIWIGMHHLVCDAVSWNTVLEDLQSAYEQRLRGSAPRLPPSTTPYLNQAATQAMTDPSPAILSPSLPIEGPGPNTVDSIETVEFELPVMTSHDLEGRLIDAIGQGIRHWMGIPGVAIDVERNGREAESLRTVGWFTEIIPVWNTSAGSDTLTAFRPGAEVLFNYFGRLDSYLPDNPVFVTAPESPGAMRSPHQIRTHLLEISASIVGGRLHMSWAYSRNIHSRGIIENLAQHCKQSLSGHLGPTDTANKTEGTPPSVTLARFSAAEDVLPLTPLQEGLLYHLLDAHASGAYHQQVICTLPGSVDIGTLRLAWTKVIENNPSLRVAFVFGNADPAVQVICAECEAEWFIADWGALTPEAFSASLDEYLAEDLRRGFVFNQPPLLRLALFRNPNGEWVLVWSHHHLLLDGWSLPLLIGQATEAYRQLSQGLPWRSRRSNYLRDYLAWLKAQSLEEGQAYWTSRLAGLHEPVPLPLRRIHSQEITAQDYITHRLTIDAEQSALLNAACRESRCTLSSLVSASWALVIARFTSTPEAVFGVTFALRPPELPESESAIGLFLNTLPLRVGVKHHQSVRAWLVSIRDSLEEMSRYGYVSLAKVRHWSGVPAALPLFESIVVVENYPQPAASGPESTSHLWAIERTHFPICLGVSPGTALGLRLTCDKVNFNEADSQLLLSSFADCLGLIARSLDADIASLKLPPGEPSLGVGRRVQHDRSVLHELFERQAERTPDGIAVIRGSERVSYKTLNARANSLAARLVGMGIGPERVVGIRLERGPDLATAVLGVLKAGAAYLLLDPASDDARQQGIIQDCDCRLVLESILMDSAGTDKPLAEIAVERDNLAYVVYTSGSSGQPKGCEITHEAIVNRILWSQKQYPLGPTDRVLQSAQLGFDFVIWELHAPWIAGAAVVFPEPAEIRDLQALGACIARHEVTVAHFIPTALAAFLEQPVRPSLRLVFSGGESLPVHLSKQFFTLYSARLINQYGPAEASVDVTHFECPPDVQNGPIPIGRPIDNAEIYVLTEEGSLAPHGVVGEICIGGIPIARGYRGSVRATVDRFIPMATGPYPGLRLYRTGDLGRWRADGQLEFHGRMDRQLKLRGFRIEPKEIETQLAALAGVNECVVLPWDSESGPIGLAAFVVWREGVTPSPNSCHEHLRRCLPDFMLPSTYMDVPSLPLTQTGKLDSRQLLSLLKRSPPGIEGIRPVNAIEELCCLLWEDVLGQTNISVTDNFFELGGDSITATRVAIRLSEALGRQVPVRFIFDHPEIAQLARSLDPQALASQPRRLPRDEDGSAPLGFAQTHLWLMHTLTEGKPIFHITASLRLEGAVQTDSLARAFRDLVEDFEILRTTFPLDPGGPCQRVLPVPDAVLEFHDLTGPIERRAREEIRKRIMDETTEKPFDFDAAPPFRAVLLKIEPQAYLLTLCVHHIACDGWSLGVIARRISESYRGARPSAPVWQYADFALLERQQAADGAFEKDLEYWQRQLEGLKFGEKRSPFMEKRASGINIPSRIAASMRTFAARQNATPFMLLVAAFRVLLMEITGESDLCVATLVANRDLPGMEDQIGLLLNTVLLRTSLMPDDRFVDLLRRIRQTVLDAQSHRTIPFPMVLKGLQESGVEASSLCRAMVVFQNSTTSVPALEGVLAVQSGSGTQAVPAPTTFEWILSATWSGEGLHLHLTSPAAGYSAKETDKVLETLRRIIEQAIEEPEGRISKVLRRPTVR